MAFVKLDCGILRSTLWMDRESRECFLTALLMAEPKEFTQELAQLEVRSLQETGFTVPPDWYGFVDAAGVGIIRTAGIDVEAGYTALERLGSPEPDSRSSEHGGRRLIRINGGYLVLNFMKYRDKDHTGAERAKRYRERLKQRTSHRDSNASPRDITHAECREQTADLRKELRPPLPLQNGGVETVKRVGKRQKNRERLAELVGTLRKTETTQ